MKLCGLYEFVCVFVYLCVRKNLCIELKIKT